MPDREHQHILPVSEANTVPREGELSAEPLQLITLYDVVQPYLKHVGTFIPAHTAAQHVRPGADFLEQPLVEEEELTFARLHAEQFADMTNNELRELFAVVEAEEARESSTERWELYIDDPDMLNKAGYADDVTSVTLTEQGLSRDPSNVFDDRLDVVVAYTDKDIEHEISIQHLSEDAAQTDLPSNQRFLFSKVYHGGEFRSAQSDVPGSVGHTALESTIGDNVISKDEVTQLSNLIKLHRNGQEATQAA